MQDGAASYHDSQGRAAGEQFLHLRGRRRHLFEVVQDQQDPPVTQRELHPLKEGAFTNLLDVQGLSDRRYHERWITDGSKMDKADAIGEGSAHLGGDL